MTYQINRMQSNQALVVRLADRIASNLDDALQERGAATLALSGGSTPRPLLERLSVYPLNWSAVTVTTVDERWVDEDHADSNAGLIRRHLLREAAKSANFVSMKIPSASPFEAEAAVAGNLSAFRDAIDVVVLGMGDDGHTASFFPGAEELQRALDLSSTDLCVAVRPPAAPHERMSLTLATLLRARNIYLHITGSTKWQVLQRALEPGEAVELPIRSVLRRADPPLQIYYADED